MNQLPRCHTFGLFGYIDTYDLGISEFQSLLTRKKFSEETFSSPSGIGHTQISAQLQKPNMGCTCAKFPLLAFKSKFLLLEFKLELMNRARAATRARASNQTKCSKAPLISGRGLDINIIGARGNYSASSLCSVGTQCPSGANWSWSSSSSPPSLPKPR